jgi:hypothetical protein
MIFITPELMPEVKKSMQEKGIPTKLAIENKVNEIQALIVENELNIEMKKCWHQQTEFRERIFKNTMLNKNDIKGFSRKSR